MDELLRRIKAKLSQLEELYKRIGRRMGEQDGIYRVYYGSFKAYPILQGLTERAARIFKEIAGTDYALHPLYLQLLAEGTGKKFELSHNKNWAQHVRPIGEAFLHSRFFVGVMIKYEGTRSIVRGWKRATACPTRY